MIHSRSDWKSPRFIITGEQGEGKTTLLLKILSKLTAFGIRVHGIAAPGYFSDGIRSGFDVLDVQSGKTRELCSVIPAENSTQLGRYYFRSDGLAFGKEILNRIPHLGQVDLLAIDEVGRFEIAGKVWGENIDQIMRIPGPPMIWTVRKSFVDGVTMRWPIQRQIIIETESGNHDEIIHEMMYEIRLYQSETYQR
ncbi:MAG: NTPase [Euryarchaeota archaeon ADurb.Bin294]|nr:MAG: NTPase [Euryarchaeota archaeon ADurb.Bin294]